MKRSFELVKTLMLCSFSTIGQTAKNIAIEIPEIIIPHDNTIISCWCQNSFQIGGLWLKGFIKLHHPFFFGISSLGLSLIIWRLRVLPFNANIISKYLLSKTSRFLSVLVKESFHIGKKLHGRDYRL